MEVDGSIVVERPGLPPATQRALLLALLVVGLVVVVSSAELHEWLIGFLPGAEAIIRARPVIGASIFVLFAAASAMLAFVSSAALVPVGVYVWGKAGSMLLLWSGWILGGVCAYALSRYWGRRVVKMLHSLPALEQYEHRLSRRAPFGLVFLFQIAVPSELPGYVLGLMSYPFWKYLAALALAELPYAVATVYLGASFIEGRTYALIVAGAALVTLSGTSLYGLHRRLSTLPR